MKGGMEYIRKHYRVPARRGGRILFRGCAMGTIRSADGAYLRVKLDEFNRAVLIHPTWEVEYLDAAGKEPM